MGGFSEGSGRVIRTCESDFREEDLGSGESFKDVHGALAEVGAFFMRIGGYLRLARVNSQVETGKDDKGTPLSSQSVESVQFGTAEFTIGVVSARSENVTVGEQSRGMVGSCGLHAARRRPGAGRGIVGGRAG